MNINTCSWWTRTRHIAVDIKCLKNQNGTQETDILLHQECCRQAENVK